MELTTDNPWWNEGGLWQDPDLLKLKSARLRYHPKPFLIDDCSNPNVMTLRGPRRAGKTVALKLLVAELIEFHGWNPKNITWTALDTFRTLSQMEEHLTNLAHNFKPKLLLIDEATSVTGWQRVIKRLRDNGVLAQACIILTGSSAHDLKAGAERMAGRRGNAVNPDRVLLPLSFEDFRRQTPSSNLTKEECVRQYLRVGGFPFRVEEFLRLGNTEFQDAQSFQIFDDVLFYEFNRRRLDRSIAQEIIGRLSVVQCSSLSYESFSKPLSIAKDTARKYLDALGDAFLLATISSYDTARGRAAPRKDRKFMWIDPALGFAAKWLRQGDAAPEAARAEWAVGTALLRHHEPRIWEGLSAPRGVFTWKSSGGNEIDYLVVDKSKKFSFPIEVKYQQSISDWDFQVMERAFGDGWLVTPQTNRKRKHSESLGIANFFERASDLETVP